MKYTVRVIVDGEPLFLGDERDASRIETCRVATTDAGEDADAITTEVLRIIEEAADAASDKMAALLDGRRRAYERAKQL